MLPMTTTQRLADSVLDWKNQAIEILNEPGFSVTDPGPLHGPIRSFKVRRDERFALSSTLKLKRERLPRLRKFRPEPCA
jgi:hypothetical protein